MNRTLDEVIASNPGKSKKELLERVHGLKTWYQGMAKGAKHTNTHDWKFYLTMIQIYESLARELEERIQKEGVQ